MSKETTIYNVDDGSLYGVLVEGEEYNEHDGRSVA